MTVPKFLLPMQLQFFAEQPAEETPVVEPTEAPAEPEPVQESPVDPEPAVETATPEPEAVTVDPAEFEAMKAKLAELESQQHAEPEPVNVPAPETPAEPDPQVAAMESALKAVIEQKVQGLPEGIAALMPEGLPVTEQLAWVDKAAKAVPVKEPAADPAQPVIETIGQPTPVQTEIQVDLKDLTASQKLSNYFQEFFGK